MDAVVFGEPPELHGAFLEGLIAQSFAMEGVVQSTANVVFVKVKGRWHRLAIDHPTLHWRHQDAEPEPWSVLEKGWDYAHDDIGATHHLIGQRIEELFVLVGPDSTEVRLKLTGGQEFVICGTDQGNSWQLEPSGAGASAPAMHQ